MVVSRVVEMNWSSRLSFALLSALCSELLALRGHGPRRCYRMKKSDCAVLYISDGV